MTWTFVSIFNLHEFEFDIYYGFDIHFDIDNHYEFHNLCCFEILLEFIFIDFNVPFDLPTNLDFDIHFDFFDPKIFQNGKLET